MAVAALIAVLSVLSFHRFEAEAEAASSNLVEIIREDVEQTFARAESDMRSFAQLINPADLKPSISRQRHQLIESVMAAHLRTFSQITNYRIFSADGDTLYGAGTSTAKFNVSDREWFKSLRDESARELAISDVLIGKGVQTNTVIIAIPLRSANGRFIGAINAALDLGHFQQLIGNLKIGDKGVVVVRRSDSLKLILRRPELFGKLNEPVKSVLTDKILAGETSGIVDFVFPLDNVERITAFRRTQKYPLAIFVGLAREDVLRPWLMQTLVTGGITLVFELMLGLLFFRQQRTKQLLEYAAAEQQKILENELIGIAKVKQRTIVWANPAFETMLGYARNEMGGLPTRDIYASQATYLQLGSAAYPLMSAGNIFRGRCELMRKDRQLIWVDISGTTLSRENQESLWAVLDISEQRRAEVELEKHRLHLEKLVEERTQRLIQTEARASHLLESSADGLYGEDTEGNIRFMNPAGCQMLGYRAEAILGRSAHALFHHSRADGSPFPIAECPGHNAVLRGQETRIDSEVYWHADGHAIPVMYAVHPILQNGASTGAVISFVDMSEQRAAAEARERALHAAEQLARVRSEFLANMSHEIRTPLNGVLGFAQIGRRNVENVDKARNAFDKILSSGKLLVGVIDEILDFSKIEAGKIHIEQQPLSLVLVVDHAIELVAERARSKGLQLHIERAPDLPASCLGDQLRLTQVLLNLLSNAVKFTEHGSVTLSIARQGNQLAFTVADTGIGMNANQLALIFNPFQQADGSTTRRFGGTGLGLAISKRLVELMNGEIRAESTPGVGSRFEFRLPFAAAPAVAVDIKHETAKREQQLAGISVLVAEDDAINQMVMVENLIAEGARVTVVGNGLEAIERVQQGGPEAFDIVLMDIQMPLMDGYAATQRLRVLAPKLPIIGQTAHASAEERDKCLAAGMVAHIAKPIDPDQLAALVRRHVVANDGSSWII